MGLIILAGGKSSRMGSDKALLKWGQKTLIEYTVDKAVKYGFKDIIIVTNKPEKFQHLIATVISDVYPQLGPLSGLQAGLNYGKKEYYFVMSCDMPLFDFSLVKKLSKFINNPEYLAIVPSVKNNLEPLAAIYNRQCARIIEEMLLNSNERRVNKLLEQISLKIVNCECDKEKFFNTNTPSELAIARAKAVNQGRRIPIVSIAAAKSGTGKTTLISRIIPKLKERCLKVAVVKSDGHDFSIDHAGKDTWQFSQAGADAVAIVSPKQYAIIQHTEEKCALIEVANKLENVDLILIESRAHGIFPIIEVVRKEFYEDLITDNKDLVAVITDKENFSTEKTVLQIDDLNSIVEFILKLQ